jgi:hypothetical protein
MCIGTLGRVYGFKGRKGHCSSYTSPGSRMKGQYTQFMPERAGGSHQIGCSKNNNLPLTPDGSFVEVKEYYFGLGPTLLLASDSFKEFASCSSHRHYLSSPNQVRLLSQVSLQEYESCHHESEEVLSSGAGNHLQEQNTRNICSC